jgi:hypothetical protein
LGGVALNAVHSLMPVQAPGGWGAANRSGPVGLAAYGMPRNLVTPSLVSAPLTVPYWVVTVVMGALCHRATDSDNSARQSVAGSGRNPGRLAE